jgi:hypothetical protein
MPFHHISTNFSREKCPFVHNYLWFLQYISDLDIFRIIHRIYRDSRVSAVSISAVPYLVRFVTALNSAIPRVSAVSKKKIQRFFFKFLSKKSISDTYLIVKNYTKLGFSNSAVCALTGESLYFLYSTF